MSLMERYAGHVGPFLIFHTTLSSTTLVSTKIFGGFMKISLPARSVSLSPKVVRTGTQWKHPSTWVAWSFRSGKLIWVNLLEVATYHNPSLLPCRPTVQAHHGHSVFVTRTSLAGKGVEVAFPLGTSSYTPNRLNDSISSRTAQMICVV